MKFEEHRFSKRFPPVTCALFVIHEAPMPQIVVPRDDFPFVANRSIHRGTAAAIILPDGRFWIGVCLCAPMDQFVKKIGRQKAIGRAARAYFRKTGEPPASFTGHGQVQVASESVIVETQTGWLKDRLQHEIDEAKKRQQVVVTA
jgi:hypothetical protein